MLDICLVSLGDKNRIIHIDETEDILTSDEAVESLIAFTGNIDHLFGSHHYSFLERLTVHRIPSSSSESAKIGKFRILSTIMESKDGHGGFVTAHAPFCSQVILACRHLTVPIKLMSSPTKDFEALLHPMILSLHDKSSYGDDYYLPVELTFDEDNCTREDVQAKVKLIVALLEKDFKVMANKLLDTAILLQLAESERLIWRISNENTAQRLIDEVASTAREDAITN